MHITWYGQSCFKIKGKEVILVTDPPDKKIGINPPRIKADIVTVSHNHLSHNNIKALKEDPKVISGPGEYNIKGINIVGVSTFHDQKEGKKLGPNTAYIIEIEKIRICHLGDLGHKLSDSQLDQVDGVDILMIPVGENNLISIKEVVETINSIEPKIIIPMHYKIPGLKNKLSTLDRFCDEMGLKARGAVPKLSIKYKDLPKRESEIVILEKQ